MTERAGFFIEEKNHLTAADVENIHDVAEKEGFDQGFKKGYEDGFIKAQDEQKKALKQQELQIGQLINGLNKPFEDMQTSLCSTTVETVFNI